MRKKIGVQLGAKRKLNTGEKKIGVCHLAPSGIQTQEKKKSVCVIWLWRHEEK
jgi:hypothetical protein